MPPTTFQRPIGLAHFTVLDVPPPELVGLATRIGYAAIGLRLIAAAPGTPVYDIPAGSAAMADMRRRLDGEGIHVHDVEIATIGPGFEPRSLAAVLDSAAGLGARRLSVCADEPDLGRLTDRFAALCDLAAGFGIGVDLEWMAWRPLCRLADAVAVVTAAARPGAGVLVDALHLFRTCSRPADLAAVPPVLLRSVQLCDARAEAPVGTAAIIAEARSGRLPPGEGVLDLDALVAALPADAALSAEVPMGTALPPEERARRVYEATRALLERQRAADRTG